MKIDEKSFPSCTHGLHDSFYIKIYGSRKLMLSGESEYKSRTCSTQTIASLGPKKGEGILGKCVPCSLFFIVPDAMKITRITYNSIL